LAYQPAALERCVNPARSEAQKLIDKKYSKSIALRLI